MAPRRQIVSGPSSVDPSAAFDIPVSTAVRYGDLLFCAGQVSVNPRTGAIELGSMEHETRNTLKNLKLVLESAGSSLDKVLKTTVFITDLAEFDTMNRVYREFFPKDPPARSTVQVVALNQGFKIEIECVAGA